MKYACEFCGKVFGGELDCVNHEKEHKKEEELKVEKERKEKESINNLNKLYEEYFNALKQHQETFGNPIIHKLTYPLSDFWRTFFD